MYSCTSSRRQHMQISPAGCIGTANVLPISSVRDHGITPRTYIDDTVGLFMPCRIAAEIWSVRRCLPQLVGAVVVSKVDYRCAVLAGISGHLLNRLQRRPSSRHPNRVLSEAFQGHTPLFRDFHYSCGSRSEAIST